jgi:hypothetical protein
MKQLLFISCVALLAACNNGATKETTKDSTATTGSVAEKKALPPMAYSLPQPYQNWQTGDPNHAAVAQAALKGYETGDIATCVKGFGDSVDVRFDGYRATLSNESLAKFFAEGRAKYTSFKVIMYDWESVISEDKKEEWVTMWYKEIMTDKKGKTDSLSVVNDCKMEKGKIVVLDEKVQHFPAAKM